jgi:undecaprenyl diphosphate synthase
VDVNASQVIEKAREKIFSEEELAALDGNRIPKHVALIMDGNRRWSKKEALPVMGGHIEGAETLIRIVKAAAEIGIEVLTVYSFSTENWKRSPSEVFALMQLVKQYLLSQRATMMREGVKLATIGDLSKLPNDVVQILEETLQATKEGTKITLVLALNYGGRDELRRAVTTMFEDLLANKLKKEEISEQLIGSYLDTAKWADPELVIRTSGESRISNFLLWQISYSEIIMSKVLWPDFSPKNFLQAVLEYQQRQMRMGK